MQCLNSVILHLWSPVIWDVFWLFLSHIGIFEERGPSSFAEHPSAQICWLFPHDWIQLLHFRQEFHSSDAGFFLEHPAVN